jgi:hypothetical protein
MAPLPTPVKIENIEALRYCEGIEDLELREEIRGLSVGDFVKLTFLSGPPARGETLLVQITEIEGRAFCGTLASRPLHASLSALHSGSPVNFTASHIHSLSKNASPQEEE